MSIFYFPPDDHAQEAVDIHGNLRSMNEFRSKAVIVTNVASKVRALCDSVLVKVKMLERVREQGSVTNVAKVWVSSDSVLVKIKTLQQLPLCLSRLRQLSKFRSNQLY